MISRRDDWEPRRGVALTPTVERADELERAKLELLRTGMRYDPARRKPWPRRHPWVVGAAVLVGGMMVGRSPLFRGLLAAAAVLAAKTAAQRLTAQMVRRLNF